MWPDWTTLNKSTLNQFLAEERRRYPDPTGNFDAVIDDVTMACKLAARRASHGALGSGGTGTGTFNALGKEQHSLDVMAERLLP